MVTLHCPELSAIAPQQYTAMFSAVLIVRVEAASDAAEEPVTAVAYEATDAFLYVM
jgi:hypothetical protein